MKKILAVALCSVLLLGLVACAEEKDSTDLDSKYVNFEIVEDYGNEGKVLVDKDTGVLYMWYFLWYFCAGKVGQAMTPLYNADGTLKNIEDFE
jgi:hypothetical protein